MIMKVNVEQEKPEQAPVKQVGATGLESLKMGAARVQVDDKKIIASNYLIPNIETQVNFEKGQITIPDEIQGSPAKFPPQLNCICADVSPILTGYPRIPPGFNPLLSPLLVRLLPKYFLVLI